MSLLPFCYRVYCLWFMVIFQKQQEVFEAWGLVKPFVGSIVDLLIDLNLAVRIPYSSKFSGNNIFVNFVIQHASRKF